MTCWFCNGWAGTSAATKAVLNFKTFKSPVTKEMKV